MDSRVVVGVPALLFPKSRVALLPKPLSLVVAEEVRSKEPPTLLLDSRGTVLLCSLCFVVVVNVGCDCDAAVATGCCCCPPLLLTGLSVLPPFPGVVVVPSIVVRNFSSACFHSTGFSHCEMLVVRL